MASMKSYKGERGGAASQVNPDALVPDEGVRKAPVKPPGLLVGGDQADGF